MFVLLILISTFSVSKIFIRLYLKKHSKSYNKKINTFTGFDVCSFSYDFSLFFLNKIKNIYLSQLLLCFSSNY